MRPDVFGEIEHSPAAVEFGSGGMRLADEVSVNRPGRERAWHVGRRHFDEPDLVWLDALIFHQLVDDQILVAVFARNGEDLAAQVAQRFCRTIFLNHDRRAVAVAEVKNLHRHALLAQLHRQRRDHEGSLQSTAFDGFDDGWEIRETLRLEPSRRAGAGCEIRHRARQMSGHGQKTDVEFFTRLVSQAGVLLRAALPRLVAQQAEYSNDCYYPNDQACGGRSKHYDYSIVSYEIVRSNLRDRATVAQTVQFAPLPSLNS